MLQDVYIVSAVRTPVGKYKGAFANVRPDDLLAHVIKGAVEKVEGVDPKEINDVIIGCAMPEAEQGMNVARISTLLAGLPESVPAMTINRFCSSGLQSIAQAANAIATGQADAIIAGGVESMSMVPMGGHKNSPNPKFFENNGEHVAIAYGMGITAEKVAEQWQVTRESQEEFALLSHQKAVQAIDAGEFRQEILPYKVQSHRADLQEGKIEISETLIEDDQGPRRDTSLERLAKLRTVFRNRGSVTAGTSSQMSDGAAALLLMSEEMVKRTNATPLARFRGFSVAGCPPEIMGVGPKYAVPKLLEQTGVSLNKVDWIELNEAFAAQALAVIQDCEFDINKVNPLGGAIALGHPLGATGAIKATTVVHGLRRHQKRFGMVTMCIGTGMGAAGLIEAV